jgi:hypothetical protein
MKAVYPCINRTIVRKGGQTFRLESYSQPCTRIPPGILLKASGVVILPDGDFADA